MKEPVSVSQKAGGIYHTQQEDFPEGISVKLSPVINSSGQYVGTVTGAFNGTTITASGISDVGIITQGGVSISSSTAGTTATLPASYLLNYSNVNYTPNGATVTLTLPASSSLSSLIPNTGDYIEKVITNATSTAASKITLAAGAGETIITASSTKDILSLGGGILRMVRKANTDIWIYLSN